METRILVADDDAAIRHMVSLTLQLEGYTVEEVGDGEQALRRVKETPFPSLLILDLIMPGLDGLETLRRLGETRRRLPVLVLSCLSSPDTIVEALQNGASDYLVKPFENSKLQTRVSRLLTAAPQALPVKVSSAEQPSFIALNPKMLKIQKTIRQIAQTDVPVFIHGESGVGKEVVARALHVASNRRDKPFLKINCAAVPSELLESEMFGYERGAFTGAFNSKPGKFELADKGTLFLDEISEMSPSLQAKLLQVLQDNQYTRLGGKSVVQGDVRVVAATNANLEEALKRGSFREDLYYRLNVVNIYVPPLRERMDELSSLISYFLDKYGPKYSRADATLPPRLLLAMRQYEWPGNIRELENVIRRFLVLDSTDLVVEELQNTVRGRFPKPIQGAGAGHDGARELPFVERVNDLKRRAEGEAILEALNRTNWNRKEAAKLLTINYKSLLYRMKVLGIGSPQSTV